MGEESKKISFGFSKQLKTPSISKRSEPVKETGVQFIDCLDSKAIIVKGDDEKVDNTELVIPQRNLKAVLKDRTGPATEEKGGKDAVQLPEKPTDSLDALAAKEILESINSTDKESDTKNDTLTLLPAGEEQVGIDKESTLEDYESVPVTAYGLAMLRGMGWTPGQGIGKNAKLVSPSAPVLRPRGMGLGADKIAAAAPAVNSETGEELKVVKGAFVLVTGGSYKGMYGEIEGFDEDAGRLIVKLARGHQSVSVNESMVRVVMKEEFGKNSRVLNAAKFAEYKERNGDAAVKSEPVKVKSEPVARIKEERRSPATGDVQERDRVKNRDKDRARDRSRDRERDRSRDEERRSWSEKHKSRSRR